jgi:hypothetical protein
LFSLMKCTILYKNKAFSKSELVKKPHMIKPCSILLYLSQIKADRYVIRDEAV